MTLEPHSCLHTHTEFCDGIGTVDEYCKSALDRGLISVGFSAHAPLPPSLEIDSNWHLSMSKLEEYRDAVLTAKEKWRNRIDVFLGLEVDFIPGYISPSDDFFQKLGMDYMIGSVHCVLPASADLHWAREKYGNELLCIDGTDEQFAYLIEHGFNGSAQKLVEAYYDSVRALCESGGFTILGHADLILKNNFGNRFFSKHETWYNDAIKKVADTIRGKDIIVEVNTGGMIRGRTSEPYPHLEFLKLLRGAGVKVTVNSDAHKPVNVAGLYKAALDALRKTNFHEYYAAKNEDGKLQWIKVPLKNLFDF